MRLRLLPEPLDSCVTVTVKTDILHGPCGPGGHAWHHVTVDVEGDGDGRVSEDFLHYLRVRALREQEAR